ncbi:MAG TPA: glycosyl hydrolase family 18 protein [Bacteroidota bacterium]|nr:glycosyl hydrolase family 18 protein [Bacteroidota bacterium]
MLKKIITFVLIFISLNIFAQSRKVIGYYPSWNKASFPANQVKYEYLTHIIHAFIYPTDDGSELVVPYGFEFPALISAAHQKNVKVILGIGGWGQSNGFSPVVSDTAKRRKFINDVVEMCKVYGYDGVDLDWEYPKSNDRNNLTLLMRELKGELLKLNPSMTLSIAAPSTDWNNGYDWNEVKNILDWIGIMTYDFHGSWTNHSGHNSPLYTPKNDADGSVEQSFKYYIAKGIPSDKLCIGVGFYGWLFTSKSLYGASTAASQITYTNIVPRLSSGWKYNWDSVSFVPYLTDPNNTQVLSYDDTLSVKYKCEYIKKNNIGGLIIWAIGQDKVGSTQPLLETVGNNLLKNVSGINEVIKPEEFILQQNYPNPFNSQTHISFTLQDSRDIFKVKLSVFDLMGREIDVIINDMMRKGSYKITYEPKKISSGIYYYSLNVNGNIFTRKMLYLK